MHTVGIVVTAIGGIMTAVTLFGLVIFYLHVRPEVSSLRPSEVEEVQVKLKENWRSFFGGLVVLVVGILML